MNGLKKQINKTKILYPQLLIIHMNINIYQKIVLFKHWTAPIIVLKLKIKIKKLILHQMIINM
jgi:hypothetical protein